MIHTKTGAWPATGQAPESFDLWRERELRLPVAMYFVVLLFPVIADAASDGSVGDKPLGFYGQSRGDVFDEDLSCKAINDAARKTWNSPQVSVITYNTKPDGTLKPHLELRVIGEREFEKFAFSTKWQTYRRGQVATVGQRGPIWNACKLIGTEQVGGQAELHYTAIWRSFPYEAATDIWLSASEGRFQKIQSRFPDKLWKFPFATALDVFTYDPAQVEVPNVDGK